MKNKSKGFYLTAAAAVLSLAGICLYPTVQYQWMGAYILLAIAVVLAVLGAFIKCSCANLIPCVNAVLTASAAVWATKPMVDQIAYVVSALDPFSTIATFVVFVALVAVAMILNIAAAFIPQNK